MNEDRRPNDGAFELALGERGGQLLVFMRIYDDALIYRDPGSLRLDASHHIRVSFIQTDGEDGRITLVFASPGVVTPYRMGPEWKFAATGTPENLVQAAMDPFEHGVQVEFRMPLAMLSSRG